jgi:hypothetical protein
MERSWITTGSIYVDSVVNPITAGCDYDYIPDKFYFLETPSTKETMKEVKEMVPDITAAYDSQISDIEIEVTELETENDFEGIYDHVTEAISESRENDAEVAIDITPGRKFMTAITFATGMRENADHVYYLYLKTRARGLTYSELPRTGTELYDFTEVM